MKHLISFKLGGGNAMLRGKANYDVKKVLELGFAATAKLKPQTQQRAPQSTDSKQFNLIQIQIPDRMLVYLEIKQLFGKGSIKWERTQEQSILS